MAQRRKGERVLGPYPHAGRWRLIVVGPGGEKTRQEYESKKEAERVKVWVTRELQIAEERTIGDTKKEYAMYLRDEKQNKPGSVEDTEYRLGMFFVEVGEDGKVSRRLDDEALSSITPKKGAELYAALRHRKTKSGKPLSVDSHRNILAEAKSFLKWCAGKKWVVRNPLDEVEGVGRRRHGKEQLRIDEARRWQAKAIELADRGEGGAIAAMMCLLMGMRCSEVVSRVVRDLDDDGKLLWIPDSKTLAGRRKLQVPDFLQPYLIGLAKGREASAMLFGEHWRDWPRKWVQRICKAAGVPKVTAHAMRGLHSTLAVDSGITSHAVAAALGHESFKTTAESYAQADAVASAKQKRALEVLTGRKLAS
ncbi:MAG TPA: site-specific integrase [Polyangia bacterium]|nr:site-specific integrase [Polyangia bacterium]